MKASKFLNSAGLETISSAIKEAEKITGGELVIRINDKSDDYNEAYWKSGALLIVLYLFAAAILRILSIDIPLLDSLLMVPAGAALSFLAGTIAAIIIPPYRRLVIGREGMHYYTNLKAHEAFLHDEVFNTKFRTGILIYLSLFEKTAIILGDSGINAKVRQEEWQAITSSITAGIKAGRKAEAIAQSIKMCGDLLEKSGVKKEAGDIDELSNKVRIGR